MLSTYSRKSFLSSFSSYSSELYSSSCLLGNSGRTGNTLRLPLFCCKRQLWLLPFDYSMTLCTLQSIITQLSTTLSQASCSFSFFSILFLILITCFLEENLFRITSASSRVIFPLRWRHCSSQSSKTYPMQSSRKFIFLSKSLRSSCLPISSRTQSKCRIVVQLGAIPKKSKTQQKEQATYEKKLNWLLLIDLALLYSQIFEEISIQQLYSLYFIMMSMVAMKVLNSPPIQERVSSYFLKDRQMERERLDFLTQRVTYSVTPLLIVGLYTYLCVGQ